MNGALVDLAIALALPTAAGYAVVLARALYRRAQRERDRRTPPAVVEPGRLRADLHRLHTQLEDTENTPDVYAKGVRCRALRAAYVDLLTVACREHGVEPPTAGSVSRAEIYRLEAELRLAGLDVRVRDGAPSAGPAPSF